MERPTGCPDRPRGLAAQRWRSGTLLRRLRDPAAWHVRIEAPPPILRAADRRRVSLPGAPLPLRHPLPVHPRRERVHLRQYRAVLRPLHAAVPPAGGAPARRRRRDHPARGPRPPQDPPRLGLDDRAAVVDPHRRAPPRHGLARPPRRGLQPEGPARDGDPRQGPPPLHGVRRQPRPLLPRLHRLLVRRQRVHPRPQLHLPGELPRPPPREVLRLRRLADEPRRRGGQPRRRLLSRPLRVELSHPPAGRRGPRPRRALHLRPHPRPRRGADRVEARRGPAPRARRRLRGPRLPKHGADPEGPTARSSTTRRGSSSTASGSS